MTEFQKLSPLRLKHWVYHCTLSACARTFHICAGTALGSAVWSLWGDDHRSGALRALLVMLVAALLGLTILPRARRAFASVVSPVVIWIRWWNVESMAAWLVVSASAIYLIGKHAPTVWLLRIPTGAAVLSFSVLLAILAASSRRRWERWRRCRSKPRSDHVALVVRRIQEAVSLWAVLAGALIAASCAEQGLPLSSVFACLVPIALLLTANASLGPFELARAVTDSPFSMSRHGWLSHYAGRAFTLSLECVFVLSVCGIISLTAAARTLGVASAILTLSLVCLLTVLVWQKVVFDRLAESITTGPGFADGRFALYLRSFASDGQLPLDPLDATGRTLETPANDHDHASGIEEGLMNALAPAGIPLIGIGGEASQHLFQAEMVESDWLQKVCDLSERALCVIMTVGPSSGVLSELEHLWRAQLFDKTLLIIPPQYGDQGRDEAWRSTVQRAARLGLELPGSVHEGALFALHADGRLRNLLPLRSTLVPDLRAGIVALLPARVLQQRAFHGLAHLAGAVHLGAASGGPEHG